ncbi:MAG: carboxypeptidase regulatory-like domain-containing protein [Planctomycetota bacterium]
MRVPAAVAIVLSSCSLTHVAVAQNPPREVHGRVIDRDGKPVAGCAVDLIGLGEHVETAALLQSATKTDADGHYRVTTTRTDYHVVAAATAGCQVCFQRLSTITGIETAPDLLMLRGTTLHGRVRDQDGRTIADALVLVQDPIAVERACSSWFESMARSDARGIVHVPGVPRTGMLATIEAPGYATVRRFVTHDSAFDVTMTATGLVRGRVLDGSGAPVAHAAVRMTTVGALPVVRPTHTDTDGCFVMSAPATPRFRICADTDDGRFCSALLRGPGDDVVLRPCEDPRETRHIVLRCVDDATGEPITAFRASHDWNPGANSAMRLMQHLRLDRTYQDRAEFELRRNRQIPTFGALVVDALGHGFAVLELTADPATELVARLPAQCVLTGLVTDAATGKPAVGYRVRALPYSAVNSIGGPPDRDSVVTDAAGRYRIERLSPGDYGVQTYGAANQASDCERVTLAAGATVALDLTGEPDTFVDITLQGEVPAGGPAAIVWQKAFGHSARTEMDHRCWSPIPPPQPLDGPREFRVGPLGDDVLEALLRLPMGDRVGNDLEIVLGRLDSAQTTLTLPSLDRVTCHGKVTLPPHTPTERIAVLAHRVQTVASYSSSSRRPLLVGLDSDGTFVMGLPPGSYVMQLADLETGIVFHTETEPLTVIAGTPAEIELRPDLHWLELTFVCSEPEQPPACSIVAISVYVPQRDDIPRALRFDMFDGNHVALHRKVGIGTRTMRLLVPAATVTLQAGQGINALFPERERSTNEATEKITVDVSQRVHQVTLRLPPLPD